MKLNSSGTKVKQHEAAEKNEEGGEKWMLSPDQPSSSSHSTTISNSTLTSPVSSLVSQCSEQERQLAQTALMEFRRGNYSAAITALTQMESGGSYTSGTPTAQSSGGAAVQSTARVGTEKQSARVTVGAPPTNSSSAASGGNAAAGTAGGNLSGAPGATSNVRPMDFKIAHNKAVAEYYRGELRKTDQFRRALNSVCNAAHLNIEDLDSLEGPTHCVIFFNQAVLLYHMRQYSTAIRILNALLPYIETMDESLAHRVILLLGELHLCAHRPDRVLSLVAYADSHFAPLPSSSPQGVPPLTSSPLQPPSSSVSSSTPKDGKESQPILGEGLNGGWEWFRLKLSMLKTRAYLATHALKSCKRELKAIMTSGGVSPASVFLKGNLEYLRGNYRKAIKVLNSIPQTEHTFKDTGESLAVAYYNGMACIHQCMGKPNLACHYLNRAMQENDAALSSLPPPEQGERLSGRPLHCLSGDRSPWLLHNMGLCLLHSGRPIQAFDCLVAAVRFHHADPRLWLRLAECCIAAHHPGNEADFDLSARRKDLVQGVVGAPPHRKVVLTSHLNKDDKYSCDGQSSAIPVPSLEFASLCLRNSLQLILPNAHIPSPAASSSVEEDGSTAGKGQKPGNSSAPSEEGADKSAHNSHPRLGPVTEGSSINSSIVGGGNGNGISSGMGGSYTGDLGALQCSILAASAYVSLCLGDCTIALTHAQNLLAQPRLSGAHRLLGHLYAAEALILLDRLAEAVTHLNPENVWDISLTVPAAPFEGVTLLVSDGDAREDASAGSKGVDSMPTPSTLPSTTSTSTTISSSTPSSTASSENGRILKAWFPATLATARVVMQYNLAVAFAIRGELEKAAETLKQVWKSKGPGCDVPIHVIMLALYIELQLGHADVSRSLIKQHSPQYR
ncbi:CCR4-NOT transcription complex subunit 10 [Ischnura elegans]|uniref:CCR4-NOT transcription complex subunit 10 n=1 Tax=Ischnura elegans TaxID=197161 RepID=UPI001ED89D61|nr:CCR4-NOT transcription complex subunit 10 [Ischnura elegans]